MPWLKLGKAHRNAREDGGTEAHERLAICRSASAERNRRSGVMTSMSFRRQAARHAPERPC
jgi:hypothetical protein